MILQLGYVSSSIRKNLLVDVTIKSSSNLTPGLWAKL